jgi:peptidoglycan/LPS O-acetylase OafA/YrhL
MSERQARLSTKPHYEILDGLRGVAAMAVVIFHILETFYLGDAFKHPFNHGYLAVDFFFLLSGFVVAYAYDDRWDRMTVGGFFKRRLIRLQPMVVMGNIIGALMFYLQAGPSFPLIAATPLWKLVVVMLVGCTMIPLLPSMDIRGWQEMHPLDGPAWSLFFEYVANIFYALGLRKASKRVLALLAALSAGLLLYLLVLGRRGDVIGGWMVNGEQLRIGFARLLFPFFAGMLMMRSGWRIRVRGAFGWCSLLLLISFGIPRLGGPHHLWMNGLYEAFAIMIVFPVIIAMGAGDNVRDGVEAKVCRFLGDISYPLYITHYALIYTYTEWVVDRKPALSKSVPMGVALFVTALAIAYACLKLFDEPVRRWLSARFLGRQNSDSTVHTNA